MRSEENKSLDWWRYPVAIIAFTAMYFFLPIVVNLFYSLVNFISPNIYKSSAEWIYIVSDIIAVSMAFECVEEIMLKQKYTFQAVWAAIVAIYTFYTAFTNWLFDYTTLIQLISMLLVGVVCIVYVGISCKKNAEAKAKELISQ